MPLSRIDEIVLWNQQIERERYILVNNASIMLNLVPTHIWNDTISKAELKQKAYLIGNWRDFQFSLCQKKVAFHKICYFICGVIPGTAYQLVVIDIDVKKRLSNFECLFIFMKQLNQFLQVEKPFRINRTGSGGFHLLYLTDNAIEIRNNKNLTICDFVKAFAWIKKIDIRGTGGFIFAPPSQFRGGLQYETIWANPVSINQSEKFRPSRE